ncbi:OLC1v1005140C1 [Oldenlandia corymbosa var. corymbosa]|uniref:OLC1v1005140C1 n=1 Tax=Oldenlandia corymbosa var. corymbosa TaxID=529605 RepID=A0AAV1DGW6_OLDCO|nr:OLC1v1005140C1 [Oldenlandia corymbosa var. corymbosa]
MAQITSLLGPPEIHAPSASTVNAAPAAATGNPFMDLMVANYNNSSDEYLRNPMMGYTENGSATFLSSGNPCLDFFFHVVPDTTQESLIKRLQLAWDSNPLMTLKLICNLRGVRGIGKSDKEGYYTAALWLHDHHPKTLACNVAPMADFGYFKDFPEILHRLLEGADVRKRAKEAHGRKTIGRRGGRGRGGVRMAGRGRGPFSGGNSKRVSNWRKNKNGTTAEVRILANLTRQAIEKQNASLQRHAKKIEKAKKAVERYIRDPDYKFLHERVSEFFAESLKRDMEFFNSGELKKIGLAAKWCPSLDSMFDKSTLLCESIARKVFPKDAYPEYQGIEDAHYAYRVRDRLRKEVLVPLRKALELPEVFIGANDWGSIPYNRVASVAMKQYKEKFLKHDKERFEEYLNNVKSGKAKIAAGALLPHEIIAALNDDDGGQVAELQWQRMVDDLAKNGKLKNCLSICDVSGSMSGIPMEVSVALGVLVSELSDEPWKGNLITFSTNPSLQRVQGDSLKAKTNFVRRMEWGMNTDFQKVFDLILQVAVKGNLKEEEMIKRLFVFSDMEFDQASMRPWETDYQTIVRKYREKGYGNCVPEIVFWNLRDSMATPVPGNQNGVALVSGFSKNLLTLFLEDNGELNPESVMVAAVSGKEYEKLVVVD